MSVQKQQAHDFSGSTDQRTGQWFPVKSPQSLGDISETTTKPMSRSSSSGSTAKLKAVAPTGQFRAKADLRETTMKHHKTIGNHRFPQIGLPPVLISFIISMYFSGILHSEPSIWGYIVYETMKPPMRLAMKEGAANSEDPCPPPGRMRTLIS